MTKKRRPDQTHTEQKRRTGKPNGSPSEQPTITRRRARTRVFACARKDFR